MHIERFVDKLAAVEARHSRELVLTLTEARGLHEDITRVLARLEQSVQTAETQDTVKITMTGGSFKDS